MLSAFTLFLLKVADTSFHLYAVLPRDLSTYLKNAYRYFRLIVTITSTISFAGFSPGHLLIHIHATDEMRQARQPSCMQGVHKQARRAFDEQNAYQYKGDKHANRTQEPLCGGKPHQFEGTFFGNVKRGPSRRTHMVHRKIPASQESASLGNFSIS